MYIGRTGELEAMQNYSHLFCDDVKTVIQARTGVSSFQVLQLGHLDWKNQSGLSVEITGIEIEWALFNFEEKNVTCFKKLDNKILPPSLCDSEYSTHKLKFHTILRYILPKISRFKEKRWKLNTESCIPTKQSQSLNC